MMDVDDIITLALQQSREIEDVLRRRIIHLQVEQTLLQGIISELRSRVAELERPITAPESEAK